MNPISTPLLVKLLAGASLVLAVAAGVQTWRLHSAEADHSKLVAGYEKRIGTAEKTAREASETNRSLEAELQRKTLENQNALAREREAAARLAADLRIDNGRLRDSIAAFAASRDQAGADTTDACRHRAATLGELLGEALQASGERALEAEGLAGDVRALLRDGRDVRAAVNPSMQ